MRAKNQNTLYALAISFLTLFNGAQVALAESGTSSTSTSATTSAPAGILIAWWICSARKRKAIGGWLLYYYMQLFSGGILSILLILTSIGTLAENLNITNWDNNFLQYFLYIVSVIPTDILLIIELIIGSMLLSKKFRNQKIYNFLRITLAAQFGFGVLACLIDSSYWPESLALDYLQVVVSALWFLYFTYSKRVKLVFIKDEWDPDIMYSPKTVAEKSVVKNFENQKNYLKYAITNKYKKISNTVPYNHNIKMGKTLNELNSTYWYRALKVCFLVLCLGLYGFLIYMTLNDYSENRHYWNVAGLIFMIALELFSIVVFAEFIRRSFYYILFGKLRPPKK